MLLKVLKFWEQILSCEKFQTRVQINQSDDECLQLQSKRQELAANHRRVKILLKVQPRVSFSVSRGC